MELTLEQSGAVDAFSQWLRAFRSGEAVRPYFVLHGLAGTGKTTLAKYLSDQHNGVTYFMAYTGKAADVLRKKGCAATTIHRKIYLPLNEQKEEAAALEAELRADPPPKEARERKIKRRLAELYSPEFTLRDDEDPIRGPVFADNALIALDECSMVSKREGEDLLSFGKPILVLGDPGQLPPIEGRGYFNSEPDYVLKEIHRQAAESPILQLAMRAREGKRLGLGTYGDSMVISKRDITKDVALGVNQILCGSNKARISFNNENRKLRGFGDIYPLKGEKIICLRNNKTDGLLNGQITESLAADYADDGDKLHFMLDDVQTVKVHRECFDEPDVLKSWPYWKRATANEFDYAYAITIHKSQGSQFESVLVYPDMFQWKPEDYARLLYTGITRAEQRVIVAL